MNIKKVCIVAPIHIWDDVRVFKKQAVSLVNNGYDVTLIARMDKSLDGTKQEGVKLIRSRISDKGKLGRILCIYQVFLQALNLRADIYHLHNPNTIPIALLLKVCSKRIIYDTHENFSQRLLFRNWIPKPLRGPMCQLVSLMEKVTAHLSVASIATQSEVVERLGEKAVLIGNSPRYNSNLIKKVMNLREGISKPSDFRLVYLGSINESRGITDIVDSLEEVNKKISARLWLIGDIDETYKQKLEELSGWKYVDFLGRLEQESAFAYVAMSDLGLICIHDVGDHSKTDPNKLYEYMSFGVPFVASDFEDWKNKLMPIDAGFFVKPSDSTLLSKAIFQAAEDANRLKVMGNKGIEYVKSNNWSHEFTKLEKIYSEVE